MSGLGALQVASRLVLGRLSLSASLPVRHPHPLVATHTLPSPLCTHPPPPTRSWSGNIASVGGEPAIFDPACYYGHAEAEWVRYSHASYCRRRRYGRERGGGAARPHRLFTQPTTKHNHITTTTINHHHTQRACRGAPALRPRSGPPTLRSRPRRRSSRRGATSTRSTTSSTCAPALPLLLRACLARLSACPLRLLPSLRSASPSSPSQTRPQCAQSHHLLHPNPPPPLQHANLFGGGYHSQAEAILKRLNAALEKGAH